MRTAHPSGVGRTDTRVKASARNGPEPPEAIEVATSAASFAVANASAVAFDLPVKRVSCVSMTVHSVRLTNRPLTHRGGVGRGGGGGGACAKRPVAGSRYECLKARSYDTARRGRRLP